MLDYFQLHVRVRIIHVMSYRRCIIKPIVGTLLRISNHTT